MSAPSSEGRYSVYSEPSTTSSRTLHSRGSGTYVENGEGSSQQHMGGGPRHSRSTAEGAHASRTIDSPLVEDHIGEHDFARRRQRVRRSGGFLLDSQFASGPRTQHVQQSAVNEERKGKRSSRLPGGHINRNSMREQDRDELRVSKTRFESESEEPSPHPRDHAPAVPQPLPIDPNQLVHMALNLSESRRRDVAAGPLITPQARAASGVQREASLGNGPGGSLRKYLNEQRQTSRNLSPGGVGGSPSRHMSRSMQRSASLANPTSVRSDATYARADKARNYIELRMEYLRLLEFLPPLKLDADAPGNFFVSANNVPGSPHAQLTRVPSYAGKQHQLGRPYNPLQYIRNRRSRARERRTLDHASHEFAHVEEIRDWVDRVEQHSKRPGFRRDNTVTLPKLHGDHPSEVDPGQPSRPHKGWVFTPEELLADAYWLEQSDNKAIIESRHGRKIFPTKDAPIPELLVPRESKEYPDKRRRSWVDDIAGNPDTVLPGNESDKGSDRGRKRRLLPGFHADSPRHGKHSRRTSRLRGLDSDTSDSENESKKGRPRIVVDTEHNTGPLALQMENMLKKQAADAQAKSPTIISPDTPNKWGRDQVDGSEPKTARDSLDVPRTTNGFVGIDRQGSFKMPPRARTNPTINLEGHGNRSSFEDLDSTAPNTPTFEKRFPHIGTDLSPPASRGASPTRKSRRSKLNPFHQDHAQENKRSSHLETDLPEFEKQRGSRHVSEETADSAHVGHAILGPNAVRSLLGHRKNDSTTSLPSPDKLRRKGTDEPHSAVSRFFKGVKHEGSKVSGFVFRRDRAEGDDEELSDRHFSGDDTDVSAKPNKSKRPTFARSITSTTAGSISTIDQEKYHLDLPTFRPAHEAEIREDGTVLLPDHISRQDRERKSDRSPRFDRLAPPKMDLERISSASSLASIERARSHSQERINAALSRPGKVGEGGLPPTALRDRQRSASRQALDGQRHWSIAHGNERASGQPMSREAVTQADIARVRALFLCSGIKAKEISHKAYTPRDRPPEFLIRAAKTAKRDLVPVPRKEEHVLAARLLMGELETSTNSLHSATKNFKSRTLKEITDLISELRARLDDDLMPRILNSGDQAVRITSEVAGQGPLQVKQITDEIDRMLRARRRRMRWLRSFGWMMVEWALVAVMWWLWLIVVLVGSVKRVFGFGFGVIRWLLWL